MSRWGRTKSRLVLTGKAGLYCLLFHEERKVRNYQKGSECIGKYIAWSAVSEIPCEKFKKMHNISFSFWTAVFTESCKNQL